jgi:hypothetical protein
MDGLTTGLTNEFDCDAIVCSTKNSLAASHDKSEVCLSTRCEMNY